MYYRGWKETCRGSEVSVSSCLCQLLPPCHVTEAWPAPWDWGAGVRNVGPLGTWTFAQYLQDGLCLLASLTPRGRLESSAFVGGRETLVLSVADMGGLRLATGREELQQRKQEAATPTGSGWSPGSQLLACYPVQASLPAESMKDLLSLPSPAWLPLPGPLCNLPTSTPAALEDSAEGAEAGSLAGGAEEAPSPPLPFQPPVCLRQTKYRARVLCLIWRMRRQVTCDASEPFISPADTYLVPAMCQTQFCPSYLCSLISSWKQPLRKELLLSHLWEI